MNIKICLFAGALFLTSSLCAWDRPGHSVTGAIAYLDLAEHHPEVATKIAAILKSSPDYNSMLNWKATIANTDESEPSMLFQLAARWPDDIKMDGSGRDKSPHNSHPWHFVDYPTGPDAAGHDPKAPNLLTAFASLRSEWDEADDDAARAVLICWFIHLTGDSHQPLHAASYFSSDYPKGDGGGNAWRIRKMQTSAELHAYWDNVIIIGANAAQTASDVQKIAEDIAAKYPRSSLPQLVQNTKLEDWVKKETFPLAVHSAYLDGNLPLPQPGHPTVLGKEYATKAHDLAEQQMALAGYRISDFFVKLFAQTPGAPTSGSN